MKKIVIPILVIIIFLSTSNSIVYADANTWVQDAFDATHSFINEKPKLSDRMSFLNSFLNFFRKLIRTINYILLVILGALSIISLSITGIRYIIALNNPNRLQNARNNLHTVFLGMFIGFGAFIIWRLAMGVIELILSAMASK